MTPADQSFLIRLRAVLASVHSDKKLRIPSVARAIGVSERQFQRRVQSLTGMTPAQYLGEYRLQRASEYLHENHSIGDAAHAAGFSSHAYFAHRFKKRFGVTPSSFRKRNPTLNS